MIIILLYRPVEYLLDYEELQNDIDQIASWAEKKHITFNVKN